MAKVIAASGWATGRPTWYRSPAVDPRFGKRRLRRGTPTAIGDVVASFLRRGEAKPRAGRPRSKTAAVFTGYEALGPPFTTHAEPVFYRSGVLTIVVEDSAWLTELSFLRDEIIERLNEALADEKVESIRLRQGTLTRTRVRPAPVRSPDPELDPVQARNIEAIGSLVPDDELRAAVMKAARWLYR